MEDPGFMARASQRVDSEHGGEVDEDRREVSRLDARGSVTDSIDSAVLAQTKTEGEGFEPSVRQ